MAFHFNTSNRQPFIDHFSAMPEVGPTTAAAVFDTLHHLPFLQPNMTPASYINERIRYELYMADEAVKAARSSVGLVDLANHGRRIAMWATILNYITT